ncbi:acyl-coenzyme A thioesterase 9, mitochondrial-like isoform X1 [Neodiprion fabricii]|uniref:acyl-coenzyme A thioesterase 9, mitochondrial-like isoform X1 n=1 Tax=Neodiprion fabricii TaxID=2872261 RepID=UPI001ED9538E|nr:acyl-coenzyme A thioesterase 9, mitochondrial-like isoform X1 [Neodiprion fabricii]XP_046410165.1 acyl-coenzyme A thioesterase 9, mitochondrial-like isoform X1 [Neodiprion fabricii]XP_046410167.1 acyl-coenzyme A thioesterase 9, mitochondrial-like isoform X1 [Neodiprion fabricii]
MALSVLLKNTLRQPLLLRKTLTSFHRFLLEERKTDISGHEAIDGTMSDVRKNLMKLMGIKVGYSPLQPSREHLLKLLPASQDELPPRSMQDSFSAAILPLSSDLVLQEKYVAFLGSVRLGRLMEDMDLFAVWIASKHLLNPKMKEGDILPHVLVTALVDKVDFTDYIPKATGDIRLSGHVSWVGNSTMEVVVWLEQKDQNNWHKLTRALFLMAARNSLNTRSAFVNKLVPASEHEMQILQGGEARKRRRQEVQTQSLIKMVPTVEEQQIIHDVFIKTIDVKHYLSSRRTLPPGSVWMESSEISNLIYSHPEDRNYHNKVFGGFLMRHALELSWSSALFFGKQRPRLMHISDIVFHQPVDVSSIIKMFSNVVYTEHNLMQIAVYAEVYSPDNDAVVTTNEFHYTYQINDKCKVVLPRTYHGKFQTINRYSFLDLLLYLKRNKLIIFIKFTIIFQRQCNI